QVYSFSRLAWHVIQETSGAAKQHISSTGMQMMLRKIIEHRDEPFLVFQKAIEKQGFIEELEGVMTEFKRHCITPQTLKEQIDHIEHIQNKNQLRSEEHTSELQSRFDLVVRLLLEKKKNNTI